MGAEARRGAAHRRLLTLAWPLPLLQTNDGAGLVIDGFPRTALQVGLDTAAAGQGWAWAGKGWDGLGWDCRAWQGCAGLEWARQGRAGQSRVIRLD